MFIFCVNTLMYLYACCWCHNISSISRILHSPKYYEMCVAHTCMHHMSKHVYIVYVCMLYTHITFVLLSYCSLLMCILTLMKPCTMYHKENLWNF